MSNLLIAALILLYTFQSSFCNLYAKHYPGKSEYASPVYSVIYGAIVAAVTFACGGFAFSPSHFTLIAGAVNGLVLVVYNTLIIRAAKLGPFSITMIFNLSGGILLPLLWSSLHYGEKLSVWQLLAILVMLISFVLLNIERKEADTGKRNISAPFIITNILLGCANGCYGMLMNSAERRFDGRENAEMIIITFAVSAALALILLIIKAGRETLPAFKQSRKSAAFALAASVSACAAINLLMHILSLVNVAVLYTLNNGGVLIVSVIWSAVVLKEKPGKLKTAGLVLAVAAVFALSVL